MPHYNGKPAKWPDESEAQYLERLRTWANANGTAAREEVRLMIEERERNERAVRLKRDQQTISRSGGDHFLPSGLYTDGGLLNDAPSAPDAPTPSDSSSSDFSGGGGDFGGGGSSDSY